MLTKMQSRIEPPVCASVNPAHPLARGLVGCWLLNEGAGGTAHDVSGHHRDGVFSGDPMWSEGSFGRAVQLDGVDDWITMGDCLDLGTDDITVLALVNYSAANQPDVWASSHHGAIVGKGYLSGGKGYGLLVDPTNRIGWQVRNLSSFFGIGSNTALNDGSWHLAVGVCDRDDSAGVRLYIDGVQQSVTADATAFDGIDLNGSSAFAIGSRQDEAGGWYWDFLGSVAMVCVWKRVLSEAEIRKLYQNPFAMFAPRRCSAVFSASAGGVVQCTGSITAISSASATMRIARTVTGTTAGVASVAGNLSQAGITRLSGTVNGRSVLLAVLKVTGPEVPSSPVPQGQMTWRSEALLNGATRTAFMLGTSLTQGWFWVRRPGCTAVYRGPSLTQVDLSRILYVAEPDAREITLPAYLSHPPGSAHCYLVRRFNGCGGQEKTIAAAAMLRVAPDGQRAPSRPNAVHGLWSRHTDAAGVRLVWFYCPLDQEVAAGQFNLYGSDATGELDFENPIAVVRYDGRRFYGWDGSTLANGENRFLVRAVSTSGTEGTPSTSVLRHVATAPPAPPVILAATSF